jgi:hypothetical protein
MLPVTSHALVKLFLVLMSPTIVVVLWAIDAEKYYPDNLKAEK